MAQQITNVIFHRLFKKSYKKRIKPNSQLVEKFTDRYQLFIENRDSSTLKDHKLTGDLVGFRSFSITGDIRVVYRLNSPSTAEFIDVGTHNQVYR